MSSINRNTDEDFQSNVKIVGSIVIFISPFLIFLLLELSLFFASNLTNSTLFENKIQTDQRAGNSFWVSTVHQPKFISDLKSNKNKIAIFGGSSAYGYGSPIGMDDFIRSSNKGYIVHNYSMLGQPFVGFQDELINIVIGYYDHIIIYSGHNEIYSHLLKKSKDLGIDYGIPHGEDLDSASVFRAHELKKETLISKINLLEGNSTSIKNFSLRFANYLLYESRVVNFFNRFWWKFVGSKKQADNQNFNNIDKTPYYLKKPFLSSSDRNEIVKRYKESINNIFSNLSKNQSLFLLTVPANDLYPPSSDYALNVDLESANSYLDSLYLSLEKNKKFKIEDLNSIPDGAHKLYLSALECTNFFKDLNKPIDSVCMQKAMLARQKDGIPFRVLPSLNELIRNMEKPSNVSILDFENKFNNYTKEIYLNSFIDFQHPSSLGHAFIAEDILRHITKNKELKISLINKCGEYKIITSKNESDFKTTKEKYQHASMVNAGWLKSFIQNFHSNYMHKYYLEKVNQNLDYCSISKS